jgi:hypothetical protein
MSDAPRVPTLFTSRLRLLAAEVSTITSNETIEGTLLPTGVARLAAINVNEKLKAQALGLQGPAFQPVIAMALNPKSVRFSQPKRFTKKDTREGSVFFHFTNTRGQNNDILTMSFTGNTGNIDRRGSVGTFNTPGTFSEDRDVPDRSGPDTGALAKLITWHNLYQLTREPMILADQTLNDFSIRYSSALFPIDIILHGFFSKVLEFEENASKPNSREYNFEFIVNETEPDLDQLLVELGNVISTPPGAAAVNNIEAGDRGSRSITREIPGSGAIPGDGT